MHEAVEERLLVCPVSPPLLLELEKRPASEKGEGYSQLMDHLSKRLSVQVNLVIFSEGFRAMMTGKQIEREIAYSHFLDASSSKYRLDFPEGSDAGSAEKAAEPIFNAVESYSISQILGYTENERPQYMSHLRKERYYHR